MSDEVNALKCVRETLANALSLLPPSECRHEQIKYSIKCFLLKPSLSILAKELQKNDSLPSPLADTLCQEWLLRASEFRNFLIKKFDGLCERIETCPDNLGRIMSYRDAFQQRYTYFLRLWMDDIIRLARESFPEERGTAPTPSLPQSEPDLQISGRGHPLEAVAILERAYAYARTISQAEKRRLAHATGLEPRQVIIWYQNRRNRTERLLELAAQRAAGLSPPQTSPPSATTGCLTPVNDEKTSASSSLHKRNPSLDGAEFFCVEPNQSKRPRLETGNPLFSMEQHSTVPTAPPTCLTSPSSSPAGIPPSAWPSESWSRNSDPTSHACSPCTATEDVVVNVPTHGEDDSGKGSHSSSDAAELFNAWTYLGEPTPEAPSLCEASGHSAFEDTYDYRNCVDASNLVRSPDTSSMAHDADHDAALQTPYQGTIELESMSVIDSEKMSRDPHWADFFERLQGV